MKVCGQSGSARIRAGSLLFTIYINGLQENVGGLFRKVADGTKIGGAASNEECCQRIEQDIGQ